MGLILSLSVAPGLGCEQDNPAEPDQPKPPATGGASTTQAGATNGGASNAVQGGASGTASTVVETGGLSGSATAGGNGGGGVAAGGSAAGGGGGGAGGSVGGSGGGSVATCEPGNVCDGFEYAEGAGFGSWQQNGTNGSLKVDKTHVFAGAQSVQIVSEPGASKRVQLERTGAPLFPAPGNVLWGRVMAYAHGLPGMSDKENKNVHYDLIQASGEQPGEYRVAGMGGVLLNYEPHDCYFGTSKPIPQDKWACWEWLFDGEKNVIEFYIDGAQQARIENKGQGCVDGTSSVWEAPTFSELRIGWVNYQSKAETTTLWLDDFVAGPERIGCPEASAETH